MSNFFDWTEAKVDNKLEPEQEPRGVDAGRSEDVWHKIARSSIVFEIIGPLLAFTQLGFFELHALVRD